MRPMCDDAPTLTQWTVQLNHGLVETSDGLAWGWGWVCWEHDPPEGMHGFETAAETLDDYQGHIRRCVGRG